LLATVFYGFYTVQLRLGTNAPCHQEAAQTQPRTLSEPAGPGEQTNPTP
jgi:hypothetical protein